MSLCTSSCFMSSDNYGRYIWQLIWALHLKIWTHFRIYSFFTEVFSNKRLARTITGQQQQHEMVTTKTTTTTHSDLHKLLSVQELIFPIHLWNMNTSSEKLMLICTHHFIIGGYIWALHLKIWTHIWCPCALHLVHVIWQLWEVVSDSLSGHFIWKYELTSEFTLSSQRSFLQKTSKDNYRTTTTTTWNGNNKNNNNNTQWST